MRQNLQIALTQPSEFSDKKGYQKMAEVLKKQPDLYLILSHKIYPLNRSFMNESLFVANQAGQNGRVVIITSDIDVSLFQKVLNYIYGQELTVESCKELEKMLEAAKMLQIPRLEEEIKKRLEKSIEDFNIFALFELALKYNINWLLQLCNEEFIALGYEHINIHKSDLFQLDQPVFEEIIRNHQRLKTNREIRGLAPSYIEEIIEEYVEYRGCQIMVEKLLTVGHDSFDSWPNQKSGQNQTPEKHRNLLTKKSKSENDAQIQKKQIDFASCRGIALYGSKEKIREVLEYSAREIRNGNKEMINMINYLSRENNLSPDSNSIVSIEDFEEKIKRMTQHSQHPAKKNNVPKEEQKSKKVVEAEKKLATVEKKDSSLHVINQQESPEPPKKLEIKSAKSGPPQLFLAIPKMQKNVTF